MPSRGRTDSSEQLVVSGLSKSFPGVRALNDVSLAVRQGEVHGLVGHNGAGKSTLVKILSGASHPDSGTIEILGVPAKLNSPADALAAGIAVVHQRLELSPNLTVADNFALTRPNPGWRVDRRAAARAASERLKMFGVDIDPQSRIAELTFPARQLVAIARAVEQSARLLVLDEPTSSLSPVEIEQLFRVIRTTVEQGAATLFISHRLPEILEISDTVTVLRQGKVEATKPTAELDEERVTRLMLGRALEVVGASNGAQTASNSGWGLDAEVRQKRASDRPAVRLQMRAGEMVGLLGLPGSGRDEIVHALIGRSATLTARCTVDGSEVKPSRLLGRAVGVVPADRHHAGIFPEMTVSENISLGPLTAPRKGIRARLFRSRRDERRLVESSIDNLSIQCRGPQQKLMTLSGGNQQKVVFSRVLAQGVPALVLDEPTQGIDVGSRAEIYEILERLRAAGKAILVASQDAEELARLCSSISVIHDRQHVATFSPPFQAEELVRVASGGATASGEAEEAIGTPKPTKGRIRD